MFNRFIQIVLKYRNKRKQGIERQKYLKNGQIPWSLGYLPFRNEKIFDVLNDETNLQTFANKQIPDNFGYRLDERIVEYSWIFSQLPKSGIRILDAGSTFNYDFIVKQELLQNKDLNILTYSPEGLNFNEKRISYIYADLRDIPFKDNYFDCIVSQSTIEHIDMDNSIYGYVLEHNAQVEIKSYEYIKALQEMLRILKNNGLLLLTFPYGKFENHGFFQQFDAEMLNIILELLSVNGNYETFFYIYADNSWRVSTQNQCNTMESYNPHTQRGKGNDGAAHCRSICCIKFVKQI